VANPERSQRTHVDVSGRLLNHDEVCLELTGFLLKGRPRSGTYRSGSRNLSILLVRSAQCGTGPSTDSPTCSQALLGATFPFVEEFTAANYLTILAVFDLDPSHAIKAIAAVLVLRNNPLKVLSAGKPKEALAFPFDMIHIKKAGRMLGNDAP